MFCFQCEQTAGGTGCTGASGVCGKKADVALLQDDLTRSLLLLAMAAGETPLSPAHMDLVLDGLFTTITNVSFDGETIEQLAERVRQAAASLSSDTPSCATQTEPLRLWQADEDIRSLKSLILFGLRGMAAYAHHAKVLGYTDASVNAFFQKALLAIANVDATMDDLLPVVLELGHVNFRCMELLDQANTETYGDPAPITVPLTVEPGPFIVVTGHDLKDLQLLLEQTEGKGINIYTHGEMLPAHAYPKLKAYSHLKGNFGTAWQNQQREFANLPAPILFTTNCIMPVKESYQDRVFTTGVVQYPHMVHIGPDKDFTPVIESALRLGGYETAQSLTGINGGHTVQTGFGHAAVLGAADQVVDAVKTGALRHIFLVGGCDGARTGRNYYTEFAQKAPEDTIVLTLACGKYRFNDLDLGQLGGLPRLMDMGQCNDAYSALKVAIALAEVFQCGVNDLPLTLVLSWYEQKAVCILLTLLALGIKNIYLGPTLPAFLSPNVLNFLVKEYDIHPISTPEADLKAILG
ncbi:MAG: hydroxylamine reductase [Oscillospiraceae bacterium]